MASEHSNNAIVDLYYSEASYSPDRHSWETPDHGTRGRSKHQQSWARKLPKANRAQAPLTVSRHYDDDELLAFNLL